MRVILFGLSDNEQFPAIVEAAEMEGYQGGYSDYRFFATEVELSYESEAGVDNDEVWDTVTFQGFIPTTRDGYERVSNSAHILKRLEAEVNVCLLNGITLEDAANIAADRVAEEQKDLWRNPRNGKILAGD